MRSSPQHVQHRRALVVDQRAEHPAVALDVAEAIPEIDRALIGLIHRPAPELAQHVAEGLLAASLLGIERGEVLREAFAQPLLVIVLPADGLAPPLMRELVRDEELGKARKTAGSLRQWNGVDGKGLLITAK